MLLMRALVDALLRPVSEAEAEAIGGALAEQRRLDLFDLLCQSCGGLGVIEDLSNRWYDCRDTSHHHGDLRWDVDPQCGRAEMVYGRKRCPECDGLGSPRG
jgi:hypothetical protein